MTVLHLTPGDPQYEHFIRLGTMAESLILDMKAEGFSPTDMIGICMTAAVRIAGQHNKEAAVCEAATSVARMFQHRGNLDGPAS